MEYKRDKPLRRPVAVPPPSYPAGLIASGVLLTPDDLCHLAKATRLNITLAGDSSLIAAATEIDRALQDYVVGCHIKNTAMRRGPTLDRSESMAAWVKDGILILGGVPKSANQGWVKDGPGLLGGLAHLMRALPPSSADDPLIAGRSVRDIQDLLATALRQADVMDERPNVTFKMMKRLVHKLLGSLCVLHVLEPGLQQYASGLPTRSGRNIQRQMLMQQLSDCFQRLHGQRYTIITPNPVSNPSAPPGGPALEWTRSLFRLVADRANAKSDGSHRDEFPELRKLVNWVDRRHAAAELIKPIDDWQAKATKRTTKPASGKVKG